MDAAPLSRFQLMRLALVRIGGSLVVLSGLIFLSAADAFVLLGYGLFLRVLRENRFAPRIVEVEAEQVVVTTGPYALVRHPMCLGLIVMYAFTPLALGSLWAILPALAWLDRDEDRLASLHSGAEPVPLSASTAPAPPPPG